MPTIEETDYWGDKGIRYWKTDLPVHWEEEKLVLPNPTEATPDLWERPYFFPDRQDRWSGSLLGVVENPRNLRAGEDVVLTNVLSFDIKVWCPATKEFVDLGTEGTVWSDDNNRHRDTLPGVWDSWTAEYLEYGNDGLPPYTQELRAVQITIRCFDPTSRAVKQITVVHRFKPEDLESNVIRAVTGRLRLRWE